MAHRRLIIALLVLLTLLVFWRASLCGFVNYDDEDYVYENPRVQQGLSLGNVVWAFSDTQASNYHPLTWLSLMLDAQVGPWVNDDPPAPPTRSYHLDSLFLHALAVVLLYLALRALTGSDWRSALVAMLFGIHPLRVESVVWISERKDVLSGCCACATILAYAAYARRPAGLRYLWVLLFFTLGLLAKPMLVTLPFVLLLLDVWPLRRLAGLGLPAQSPAAPACPPRGMGALVLEKVPLLLLAMGDGALTFFLQSRDNVVWPLARLPLSARLANVVVAYVRYVGKMVWFRTLVVLYPLEPWALWQVAGAAAILLGATALVLARFRRNPWLSMGWFWFLGMLVPVIGIIQVGHQSLADRYTYLPTIGLLIMLVWSLPERLLVGRFGQIALSSVVVLVVAVLGIATWRQVDYWQNGITLWQGVADAYPTYPEPWNNLGQAYFTQLGDPENAQRMIWKALRIEPDLADAHANLASVLVGQKKYNEALVEYEKTLFLNPRDFNAMHDKALALTELGRYSEAVPIFEQVVRGRPGVASDYAALGLTLRKLGRLDEAIQNLRHACEMEPDNPAFHAMLDRSLSEKQGLGASSQPAATQPSTTNRR